MSAIAIGLAAGVVCYGGVLLKTKAGYDDALDAFGVHGIGGALGAILTGVFAKGVGLIDGHPGLVGTQALGVAAAAAYAAAVTYVLLKVIQALIGLRVDPETEYEGLDGVLHGESGYAIGPESAGEAAREADEPTRHPPGRRARSAPDRRGRRGAGRARARVY